VPTDKRQRQREGRDARREEIRRMQRRSQQRKRVFTWGPIIAIVAIVVVLLTVSGSGSGKKKVSTTNTTVATPTTAPDASTPPPSIVPVPEGAKITGDTPCPKADGTSPRTTSFAKPPPMCIDTTKHYTATITTDVGTMNATLDPKQAPATVNNFVVLARYHFFDGISFHRVIPGFVDQGGDPQGTGSGGPGYKFQDELPQAGQYKEGSLAMANSGANTNGSQFFIIVGSQGTSLPPQYSLFGQVTDGVDVAHKIEADGSPSGSPKVVHMMTSVTIKEQ
jgi:cyclophilin family peptidyl-prolyl cis-trans isomerase